jgi:hypothetical protein
MVSAKCFAGVCCWILCHSIGNLHNWNRLQILLCTSLTSLRYIWTGDWRRWKWFAKLLSFHISRENFLLRLIWVLSHPNVWDHAMCIHKKSHKKSHLSIQKCHYPLNKDSISHSLSSWGNSASSYSWAMGLCCYKITRKDWSEMHSNVPYSYGFFHFVFAMGAMYFAMLFVGWSPHQTMHK